MNKATSLAVCFSLALAPAPVFANGGDFLGGLIVGAVGATIISNANRHSTTRYGSTRYGSTMSAPGRESNREVQSSLNYFGYDAGPADGVMGSRSRNAVMAYQSLLGDPMTGDLNDYEHTILLSAYNRALVGGPDVAQVVQTSPMGARGLILQQRDAMAGVPQSAAPSAAIQPAPLPQGSEPVAATGSALPSFAGAGQTEVSLASHCNKVSLQTNSNGGFVTAATMKDPEFALSEQFCLARTYAMSTAEDLQAKITGFTPQQIQDQCLGLGPAMKDELAALSLKPEAEVLSAVQSFAMSSNMPPAQLVSTAKICLGVGYRTDNMDVAMGSALLLTGLGQNAYAELLGHHLSLGFGTSQRRDLAQAWYDTAFKAMASGDVAVAPGMPGRAEVLQKAAYMVTGAAPSQDASQAPKTVAMPKFSVSP